MKASVEKRYSGTPHKLSMEATNKQFQQGVELDNRWTVLQVIGKGAFSEILAAKDNHPSEDMKDRPFVAIKIQTACLDRSVLKSEAVVLRDLSGHQYFPKFFSFHESSSSEDPEYIVMEYLCGEDMATIRNRARSRSLTGLVPLCLASFLARDMILGLKYMHAKGYVHRDVKPSNFVRRDDKTTHFCVIDFGLTKLYRESSGALRPEKSHADFRGTTVYASPFVHEGFDQCPRDDLISVLHVFFDMIIGKLPWGDAARSKDKATAAATKRHMYNNPDEFISWLCEEVSAKSALGFELNFSAHTRNIALGIIKYLSTLRYADSPDYDWLDFQFFQLVPDSQRMNVDSIDFTFDGFNWRETSSRSAIFMTAAMSALNANNDSLAAQTGSNSRTPYVVGKQQCIENPVIRDPMLSDVSYPVVQRPSGDMTAVAETTDSKTVPSMDPLLSVPHLATFSQPSVNPNFIKIQSYKSSLQRLLREANSNIDCSVLSVGSDCKTLSVEVRKEVFKVALRWANIMKLAFLLPESSINKSILDASIEIVRKYEHFFSAHIEDDMPDRWDEFCHWQEMIGKVYELSRQLSLATVDDVENVGPIKRILEDQSCEGDKKRQKVMG